MDLEKCNLFENADILLEGFFGGNAFRDKLISFVIRKNSLSFDKMKSHNAYFVADGNFI